MSNWGSNRLHLAQSHMAGKAKMGIRICFVHLNLFLPQTDFQSDFPQHWLHHKLPWGHLDKVQLIILMVLNLLGIFS